MYQHVDAVVVRAAVWPDEPLAGDWPDLTGQAAGISSWRPWLERTLRIPGFADAVELASPDLARRVGEICAGCPIPEPAVRRAVLAVLRYLLRASGRATPFGLFAGVAPARLATTAEVRVGAGHRATARPDAGWLTTVIEQSESAPALLPQLTVQAHDLVFERDGDLVLEHRSAGGCGGSPTHARVRATPPVRAAMAAAADPIRVHDLAGKLAADFSGVPTAIIDKLLVDLIAHRLLVTGLRPPMTDPDPLGHVLALLDAAAATQIGEVRETHARLNEIADGLRQHNQAAPPPAARERARLTGMMDDLHPTGGQALAVDLRIDWDLTIPHTVAAETARAAGVLVRLAARPVLSTGWAAWHSRFLERYGPRALVPVLDAVNTDIGVGWPAGYLGGPPVTAGGLTDRDVKLLALAQRAALHHQHEIVLDEETIADLTSISPTAARQPTTELTVRVLARSVRAVQARDFTLAIVGASRTAGTITGRFLHQFDSADQDRFREAYASLPTASQNAYTVQISTPPLHASTGNVARSPQMMPHLLAIGECRDGHADRIDLDDIAVTADAYRLYLVSRARRRPLEFVVLNAVEPVNHLHPLIRFLTEASNALSTPCVAFDWGAAARLAFLPALRHGRTVLSPARWLLTAGDLPGLEASWPDWETALTRWRGRVAAPEAIYVGDGDQRIRLDLTEPAHQALLRTQLERTGMAVLRAAPSADSAGWAGGHVHEIVVPLASTAGPAPAPTWLHQVRPVGRDHGHLPGGEGRFFLKLYGHPDRYASILTRHLPTLLNDADGPARWWFQRYHDPDDHLRLRLTVPADRSANTAAAIGAWTRGLRRAGLIGRVQWDTDFPETARFGGAPALESAEEYFAADSAAAVAQLAASMTKAGADTRALTAASMLDIVIGLNGDPADGMRWLIDHARPVATAPARALYDQAVALANPADRSRLAAQPHGDRVIDCWTRRRQALIAYRAALDAAGTELAAFLLPELLHLHHVRMAGTDLDAERGCLHLARAAALSWTARTRRPT